MDVAVGIRPALARDVLARALGTQLGMRVVAFGTDPDDCAPDRLREIHPRILILDGDPVSSEEVLIRQLHQSSPSTRIVVITTRSDKGVRRRFVRAGAFAIVQNDSDLATVARAVEAASSGKPCESGAGALGPAKYPPELHGRVVAPDEDRRLTTREWEVAELVAKGLRNRAIAVRLNISVDTVKTHLNNSFHKLELDGRLALGILVRSRPAPSDGNVTSSPVRHLSLVVRGVRAAQRTRSPRTGNADVTRRLGMATSTLVGTTLQPKT